MCFKTRCLYKVKPLLYFALYAKMIKYYKHNGVLKGGQIIEEVFKRSRVLSNDFNHHYFDGKSCRTRKQ